MLETDCKQPFDLFLVGLAMLVEPPRLDPVGALDLRILVWDRQAALWGLCSMR
jgi:hypothetical protein